MTVRGAGQHLLHLRAGAPSPIAPRSGPRVCTACPDPPPVPTAPPPDALQELEQGSKQEGFLHFLFGTDCYSRALFELKKASVWPCMHPQGPESVQALSQHPPLTCIPRSTRPQECKSLGEDERARLALALARCFLLRSSGVVPPPACPPSRSVKECTAGLDDRAFHTYTQFYTNIHRWGQGRSNSSTALC